MSLGKVNGFDCTQKRGRRATGCESFLSFAEKEKGTGLDGRKQKVVLSLVFSIRGGGCPHCIKKNSEKIGGLERGPYLAGYNCLKGIERAGADRKKVGFKGQASFKGVGRGVQARPVCGRAN